MNLFRRKTVVLMVCTENICRSPMAEGLLREHLKSSTLRGRVTVDSAGTRASQPGGRPDQRAQKVAARAGVSLGGIRARRITPDDFERADYIFAMDRRNLNDLLERCPSVYQYKITLLLQLLLESGLEEVPDPYYGSVEGFLRVQELLEKAIAALIVRLEQG